LCLIDMAQALFMAGIGAFVAGCTTILLNVAINAVSPFRVPLWVTTIVALLFVTYWFTGYANSRIEKMIRRKRKIAGFAEDPKFPADDPRRKLAEKFYSLREADKWIKEQRAKGVINFSVRDVRVEDETDDRLLLPAPYTTTRLKLTIAYVLVVITMAAAIQWVIDIAPPDKVLSGSDARREVYRQFPFWASMILTWIWLAHAELRKEV